MAWTDAEINQAVGRASLPPPHTGIGPQYCSNFFLIDPSGAKDFVQKCPIRKCKFIIFYRVELNKGLSNQWLWLYYYCCLEYNCLSRDVQTLEFAGVLLQGNPIVLWGIFKRPYSLSRHQDLLRILLLFRFHAYGRVQSCLSHFITVVSSYFTWQDFGGWKEVVARATWPNDTWTTDLYL